MNLIKKGKLFQSDWLRVSASVTVCINICVLSIGISKEVNSGISISNISLLESNYKLDNNGRWSLGGRYYYKTIRMASSNIGGNKIKYTEIYNDKNKLITNFEHRGDVRVLDGGYSVEIIPSEDRGAEYSSGFIVRDNAGKIVSKNSEKFQNMEISRSVYFATYSFDRISIIENGSKVWSKKGKFSGEARFITGDKYLIFEHDDGLVQLFDIKKGKIVSNIQERQYCHIMSVNEKYCAIWAGGAPPYQLRVYNLPDFKLINEVSIKNHGNINSSLIGPDCKYLLYVTRLRSSPKNKWETNMVLLDFKNNAKKNKVVNIGIDYSGEMKFIDDGKIAYRSSRNTYLINIGENVE